MTKLYHYTLNNPTHHNKYGFTWFSPHTTNPEYVARHDHMVSLLETMLSLNKKLPGARTPEEKTLLQRQIESTDKQIDALVYELYGLTEEEIKVVEGG
jgi:hypothetical protein